MRNPVSVLVNSVRSSYALKLVLALLVVVVAVGAIGGAIYVQTGASLQEDTESSMVRSTALQAESVAEWVDHRRDETKYLADSEEVRSGDADRVRSHLRDEREEMDSAVVAVHYVDRSDYAVLASTHDDVEGTSLADAPWANDDVAGDEPTLIDPHEDETVGATVSGFVTEASGDEDRLVVLLFDLAAYSNSLEKPSAADESFTHVVNSRGTVVLSHHNARIGEPNAGQDDGKPKSMGVMRGLEGETGYVEMDMAMHGGEMSMGFAPIEGTDWVIMTHIPTAEAFALQQEISQSVIALVLVSLFGLGLIGVVVGRSTSRSIGRLAAKAEELERGDLDTELESGRRDEIGQLYDAFANMRDSLRGSLQESRQATQRAERKGQEMTRLANHLETKAADFRDVMERAADGDLTQRMGEDSTNEAMREIAAEYNEMMTEIESTTAHLKRFADEVASHSEQVTASAEEVQSASGQVTHSVQQISDSTDRQHEKFQVVSDRMEDISATTEEIASLSNEVTSLAEETATVGQQGRVAAEEAIEAMDEVDEDAEEAVEEIEQLQTQIDRVEEITEFIQEIAEQTNMLALNANIEASRSGAGDEGFSVVAGEVKELASETKSSAAEIEELVESIQRQTDRTATEVRSTREEVAASSETVESAVEALERIAGYARQTHDGTKEISAASQQQAASTQEVVAMVDEAESLSQQVTDEAGTAAAAAEEQTSALSEVTESAGDLAGRARSLQHHLDEFQTEHDATQARAPSDD